jgi:thymidylate synthase
MMAWSKAKFHPEFQVSGDKEVIAKLMRFHKNVADKTLKKAYREAAKPAKKNLKASLKGKRTKTYKIGGKKVKIKTTGSYKKSVVTKVGKAKRGTKSVFAVIGAKTKFEFIDDHGKKHRPAKYAHLVEGGRKANRIKSKRLLSSGQTIFGQEVKAAKPQKLIENAVKKTAPQAKQIITNTVDNEIKKL